jgi:hypothetical protein
MAQQNEAGRGRLSSLLWLAIFVALIYAGWNVGPLYYANYILNDKLEEIARTPRGGHVDEMIAKGIQDALRETELQEYLKPTDFKIATGEYSRTITVVYEREAKVLPGWPHTFRFTNKVEGKFF